jgi:predicted DNA-binding transcriptional regulator AlpA
MNTTHPRYLNTQEVAERLRLSEGTLANWRTKGEGPQYVKLGRKVLYAVAEIDDYEKRQSRGAAKQWAVR